MLLLWHLFQLGRVLRLLMMMSAVFLLQGFDFAKNG
jgi:hypothetical protein